MAANQLQMWLQTTVASRHLHPLALLAADEEVSSAALQGGEAKRRAALVESQLRCELQPAVGSLWEAVLPSEGRKRSSLSRWKDVGTLPTCPRAVATPRPRRRLHRQSSLLSTANPPSGLRRCAHTFTSRSARSQLRRAVPCPQHMECWKLSPRSQHLHSMPLLDLQTMRPTNRNLSFKRGSRSGDSGDGSAVVFLFACGCRRAVLSLGSTVIVAIAPSVGRRTALLSS